MVRLELRAIVALAAAVAASWEMGRPPQTRAAENAAKEAPTLEAIFPAGIAPGPQQKIQVSGKFDPWPPSVWVDRAGIRFVAETNKGRFAVEVSPEAAAGPCWVRLFNAQGASEPRLLVIDENPAMLEEEPNDSFAKPQRVAGTRTTVHGRLDKGGDVDSYAFDLEAGHTLHAALEAYVLASKMDGLLRLVDARGTQLAWNHDYVTLDPRLRWRAPCAGTYILQVMGFAYPATANIQLAGGDACVYRLHLQTGFEPQAAACLPTEFEVEPNDEPAAASPLRAWSTVAGVVDPRGDEDRFVFRAEANDVFSVAVEAASLGSELDAWLKIEDLAGKELGRADDAGGSRDPRLEWKAPAPGDYRAVVGSVVNRGGTNLAYRLTLTPARPAFEAGLDTSRIKIEAGSTNSLKFKVTRLRGFDGGLTARLAGLPDGVEAEPMAVPDETGEVTLQFTAATNAPAFQGPIEVILRETATAVDRVVPVMMTSSTVDNGVPGGYTRLVRESLDSVWLTVLPAKPPAEPAAQTPASPR